MKLPVSIVTERHSLIIKKNGDQVKEVIKRSFTSRKDRSPFFLENKKNVSKRFKTIFSGERSIAEVKDLFSRSFTKLRLT